MWSAFFSFMLVTIFWLVIRALWGEHFHAEPLREISYQDKDLLDDTEEKELLQDLHQQISIVETSTNKKKVKKVLSDLANAKRRTLTDLGVSENRTASRKDIEAGRKIPKEMWLCDNRPWGFAILQFWLCWPFSALLSQVMPTPLAALIVFLIVTLLIAATSVVEVKENWRVGVKRWGKQLPGYLSPGWQFLLLRGFFEKPEIVTLQDFVWGPQLGIAQQGKDDKHGHGDDFHLNGSLGTKGNPAPGELKVILHGAWPIDLVVLITLRVRQASKEAWWQYLNSYSREEEIGEQIGGVALAILNTYAREVEKETEKHNTGATDEEKFEKAVTAMLVFLNRMPEVSGKILQALQQLGRNRLAGILPISVSIASVSPGKEFLDLRQSIDSAKVDRLRQQIDAEGTKQRLEILNSVLDSIPDEKQRSQLIALEQLDTQREFAKDSSGLDTMLQALGLKFTREGTSNSDK